MRKSVDTGYTPREQINPWEEGDYCIYGYCTPAPGGGFFPVYTIDRFKGISDAPRIAVDRCLVQVQSYPTEDLARIAAIHFGQHRLRDGHPLKF